MRLRRACGHAFPAFPPEPRFGSNPWGLSPVPIDETLPFKPVRIAVLTVSATRGPDVDRSGALLAQRLVDAGRGLDDPARVHRDIDLIVAPQSGRVSRRDGGGAG